MNLSAPAPAPGQPSIPWYRELTRYHWWILLICSLGWTFDTMDQRLFIMARGNAMVELVGKPMQKLSPAEVTEQLRAMKQKIGAEQTPKDLKNMLIKRTADNMGRWATTVFMLGWATGGILFGIMGDKWGRARTMMLTILVYALFTAFSGLSVSAYDFMGYRFLAGMGVGGEFSAGVALLAEVIPERPRPYALGFMQGLSAIGNIIGSIIAFFVLSMSWRYLFFFGAIPALMVVAVRSKLKEPESWTNAKAAAHSGAGPRLGSFRDLFSIPRWRRNAFIGATIAVVGVTGLWGISFYSPELMARVMPPGSTSDMLSQRKSIMLTCQDVGGFFSMYGFAILSGRIGRKPTFHLACLMGLISIVVVFGTLNSGSLWQIIPYGFLLGFGTLGIFGGFAVYFPELFPTRLRSTGVSFCYNVGRYLSSVINLIPILIYGVYAKSQGELGAYRATAMTMALFYLIGNAAVLLAPETRGKPLPTDDDEGAQPA